jgi:MFS family permease
MHTRSQRLGTLAATAVSTIVLVGIAIASPWASWVSSVFKNSGLLQLAIINFLAISIISLLLSLQWLVRKRVWLALVLGAFFGSVYGAIAIIVADLLLADGSGRLSAAISNHGVIDVLVGRLIVSAATGAWLAGTLLVGGAVLIKLRIDRSDLRGPLGGSS